MEMTSTYRTKLYVSRHLRGSYTYKQNSYAHLEAQFRSVYLLKCRLQDTINQLLNTSHYTDRIRRTVRNSPAVYEFTVTFHPVFPDSFCNRKEEVNPSLSRVAQLRLLLKSARNSEGLEARCDEVY